MLLEKVFAENIFDGANDFVGLFGLHSVVGQIEELLSQISIYVVAGKLVNEREKKIVKLLAHVEERDGA